MADSCEREGEILAAVTSGQWSGGGVEELRAHAEGCASCRDLAAVASAILADQAVALRLARVPSSGVMWFRAQRRAREAAARRATRVITAVQAASLAIGLVVAIAIAGTMSIPPEVWSHWVANATTLAKWGIPFFLMLATWLVLAPVAVYIALNED